MNQIKSPILLICTLTTGAWSIQNAHASPANQKSPLAINVASLQRWNTDWPLIDEMKRAEVVTQCTGDDCWNTQEHHKVYWDENGWPRSLTPKGGGRFNKISYLLFGGAYERWDVPPPATGNFYVLYEGEGALEYGQAASKVGSCPDRDHCDIVKIETPENANDLVARISITATTDGNHLRNIQVIWPGGLCNDDVFTYHASAATCSGSYKSFVELKDLITFHPDYLNDLKRYKAIRFLNFQATNETTSESVDLNEEARWADRRLPSYSVWSDGIPVNTDQYSPKRGAPIEMMVELLNVLGADGWFTLPFTANNEYVQKFALLVKQKLNKGQKIYLEYGNEAWNFAWPFVRGANWLQAKGKQFWPSNGTPFDKQMNWFAKRTTEVCKLWKDEWGGGSDRVECVMGGHAAGAWVTENLILNCPLWKDDSRNTGNKGQTCASQVDALAIAPYFGAYIGYLDQVPNWNVDAVFSEITGSGQLQAASESLGLPVSPGRYLGEEELDDHPDQNELAVEAMDSAMEELPVEAQSSASVPAGALNQARGWMDDQAAIAQKYHVDLLAYEGGQHLVGGDNVTQLFRDTNRDQRMGEAYTQHLTDWREAGGKLFAVFDAVGPSSKSGSWGIKEYQNQLSPPKHTAVQQFMTSTECWWEGCAEGGIVSYALPDNQWRQIGLPRKLPADKNTVATVFGDDLEGLAYNTDWAVYSYDTVNGGYVNPGLTGELQQGVGYWIIQESGAKATLSLPSGSTVTPVTTKPQCPSKNGCFEIPLVAKNGAIGWNMLSHTFESEVALNQLRVVTKTNTACAAGCTLEEAKTAGIVHNQFWRYDGASYQELGGNDMIKPWYGLWVPTLMGAVDLEPKLQIPTP